MDPEMFGPYRLDALISVGGMGEVYRAFDTSRDRPVALKRLRPGLEADVEYQNRFRRESRRAGRLSSPHVIPIHDFGEIDGRLYIDMRLVDGVDLHKLITDEGPLTPHEAVDVVRQVAEALDCAHEAGLIHRDVKPSNVLLGDRSFVYLIDFGVARHDAGETSALTATGSAIGTLAYMAPELFRGEAIDRRVDIYALGCLLYEAVVGRPPFVGEGHVLMHDHIYADPPRASTEREGVPVGLDAVHGRALAKDPDDRFSTAGELARAAHDALAPTGGRVFDGGSPPQAFDNAQFSDRLDGAPRTERKESGAERPSTRAADGESRASEELSIRRGSAGAGLPKKSLAALLVGRRRGAGTATARNSVEIFPEGDGDHARTDTGRVGRMVRWRSVAVGLLAAFLTVGIVVAAVPSLRGDIEQFVLEWQAPGASDRTLPDNLTYKSGVRVVERSSTLDLTGWKKTTAQDIASGRRASRGLSLTSFVLRKTVPGAKYFIHTASSGSAADPSIWCDSHPFRVVQAEAQPSSGVRQWNVLVDISNEPDDRPFTVDLIVTFWNGFQQKSDWWGGFRVLHATEKASYRIIFPPGMPAGDVRFRYKDITASQTIPLDPSGLTVSPVPGPTPVKEITWTVDNPLPDRSYQVAWTWPDTAATSN
jgi:serine/threonine protein kinase